MSLQTILAKLRGFERTKATGVVEIDSEREGKRYLAGINNKQKRIFYEITNASTNRVIKRVVKPFITFWDGDTRFTIYEPLRELVMRGIPFSDQESYQRQFEEYTQPKELLPQESFQASDIDLISRINQRLLLNSSGIKNLELLPEVYNYKGKESIGRVVLGYNRLEGRADSPQGHQGFKISIQGRNGNELGYIKSDDTLHTSQYSPTKRVLQWNRTSHEPYGLYTDGGFEFNLDLAKRVYLSPEQTARWIANKVELGIVPKEGVIKKFEQ